MPSFFLRIVLAAALSLSALAADARLLSLVPSDAEAVIGVNFRAVMGSGIAQEIMRTATVSDTSDFNEMIALTGVDPRRDLHELIAAGFATAPGTPNKDATGIVFVTGNFSPERIGAAITAKGGKTAMHKGHTLWLPPSDSGIGRDAIAFLDGNVLLAGNEARVRRYLDRKPAPLGGPVRARVEDVSSRYDLWMVSAISPSVIADSISSKPKDLEQAAGALQGDMFQKIESVQGGLKFGSTTTLGMEMNATTAQDATALMNVLQFFQSMLAAGGGQGAAEVPSGVRNALSSVRMQTQDKTLLVSMSMEERDIVEFLRSASANRPAGAGAKPKPKAKAAPKQEEIIIIQ